MSEPPPEEPYQIEGTTPAFEPAALPGRPLTAAGAACFVPKIVSLGDYLTCIAGLVHDGAVYLAGDSAGCSGWSLTVRADPKVFTNGSYVMGFTTSYRMGQLLRYAFTPPEPETADLHKFMCTAFTDSLRQCLKDGGWAEKDKEREEGGTFLVGTHGHLFFVGSDYQVGEPADPYAAVGCGDGYALGALHATEGSKMTPQRRLDAALAAAERFSNGVRGPFTHVDTAST